MRHRAMSRGWLLAVCVLGTLASVVPTASADSVLPVWSCRASAAYVELSPLLDTQRIEPVLANGFPDRAAPDTEQCASADAGVQDVEIPGGEAAPLVTLQSAFATTSITPQIGAARDQTVASDGGVLEPLRVNIPGLDIVAEAVTASADASCVATNPVMTGSSDILSLSVNGTEILIPNDGSFADIDLLPLIRIRLNETVRTGTSATADESLTQRAVQVELLQALGGEPVSRVVIGEAKVDRHGAVCAPAPPPPTCPAGFTPQEGSDPLLCVKTVTAPCPAGSTADPDQGGACIIVRQVATPCPTGTTADPTRANACILLVQSPPAACPTGTTRDTATSNCVLVRDRPCPAGATVDPATRVCVVTNTNNVGSGENGRVGSPTGPVATCGRLTMRFVKGTRNLGTSITSRFGNRTVTRGRLVTCGSNPRPIVGARVDVVHVLPGNKRRRKTGLRSRANGLLTLILPIDLRSRSIEYAYRPDLRSTVVTSRKTLRLRVVSRTGRTLR